MTNPADPVESLEEESAADSDELSNAEAPTGQVEGPAKETILEMRQVAGLTAGSVMGLHKGSFQFRESDKEVGFSLTVHNIDDVTVVAGSATTLVDGIAVEQPTPLGSEVFNVGSACFTVRPVREEPTPEGRLAALVEARTPPRAIPVPEFVDQEPEHDQTGSSRFGSLFSKGLDETEPALDAQSWRFLESIRDIRTTVAERHRNLHPNPEELRSRLDRLDPGLWDRSVDHPLFARFPIAYSTIPWEPRFDDPERIPTSLHGPIREMSCLPWVPVTANLLYGPLGIVGSRPAVLACARNAVLSLACLTAPTDIEFSIVTAQGLVGDWDWTSSLPNSLFPSNESNYCIAVADGMAHFDGAGLDPNAVKDNDMGLIVLEQSVEDLPDYCGTIVQLTADGQCQVTNHLGEQILGTPIGVAAGFAASAALLIRSAIGDGPMVEEPLDRSVPAGGDLGMVAMPKRAADEVESDHRDGADRSTLADADRALEIIDDVLEETAPAPAVLDDSPVVGNPADDSPVEGNSVGGNIIEDPPPGHRSDVDALLDELVDDRSQDAEDSKEEIGSEERQGVSSGSEEST
ncbi:MAG: hypothetical protein ACR2QK_10325 [Acidimicrobiales bacterium]